MNTLLKLLLVKSVSFVISVPHNPSSALANELTMEFSSMKTTIKLLSGKSFRNINISSIYNLLCSKCMLVICTEKMIHVQIPE